MITLRRLTVLGLALLAPAFALAHGGGHPLRGAVSPSEATAFELARPALEKHCYRCHAKVGGKGKPKALVHLDMTSYPFAGHHAGEAGLVVRAALGAAPDGGRATMPKGDPGSVPGEDLLRILAWTDAFTLAHQPPDRHTH